MQTDQNVSHSIGHTDLSDIGSPQGKNRTAAYRENCRKRKSLSTDNSGNSSQESLKSKKAKRRLSNLDAQDYIVKHAIHNQTEPFAYAETRKQEDEVDPATFLFICSEKLLSELIAKTCLLKTSLKKAEVQSHQNSHDGEV